MPQDAGSVITALAGARVIPVMILDDPDAARPIAEALVAGGLPVLEVTLRTPNALRIIEAMSRVEGAFVGSGTVRSKEQMRQSVDAGARFMVSPGATPTLLAAGLEFPIPLLPGTASATEAMIAAEFGYTFLKFFPAEAMGGARVLRDLVSPLPDLKFCPTGGIRPAMAGDYLSLPNVVCVGGSWVTPNDLLSAGDYEGISRLAQEAAALGR